MNNIEKLQRSLKQRERCALAELDLPNCPRNVKPALYKPVARYIPGQPIVHSNFGNGTVVEVWDGKIAVYFEIHGLINLIAQGAEDPPPVPVVATPTPKQPKTVKQKRSKPAPKKAVPKAPKLSSAVAELKAQNRRDSSTETCPKCGHLLHGQLHQMTCGGKEIWEP
jgi:hypothetical protein